MFQKGKEAFFYVNINIDVSLLLDKGTLCESDTLYVKTLRLPSPFMKNNCGEEAARISRMDLNTCKLSVIIPII